MAVLCGVLGKADPHLVNKMLGYILPHKQAFEIVEGKDYCAACSGYTTDRLLVDSSEPVTNEQLADLRSWCWSNARKLPPRSMRGGFALVAGNDDGSEWILARDRLGRKPLYFFCASDYVLFASSLKAILATGITKPILDLSAVDLFLAFGCVPAPQTLIQTVRKVPPGKRVLVRRGDQLQVEIFDEFRIQHQEMDKSLAAQELRQSLANAVQESSADTLLWSAGIDCAAIATLNQRECRPVFVTLERGWQDELKMARDSAKWLGLKLTTIPAKRLTEESFFHTLRHLDEPVANVFLLPYSLILEQIGRCCDAALCGIGADEMLGGFPRFRYLQRARTAKAFVPSSIFLGLLPALPPNAFVRRGGRYLAAFKDELNAYLFLAAIFDREERRSLYTDAMIAALGDRDYAAEVLKAYFIHEDISDNVLLFDLNVALPELMLSPINRLAQVHKVNLEFPYLRETFLDFVLTVPPSVKFGVRSKPLLRQAMKGLLPPSIRFRAQRNFRVPQSGRLAALFDDIAEKVISPERVDATGLFRWSEAEHVLRSSTHNMVRRRQFWALLLLLAWFKEVVER